jgi:hypothetical protein
VTIKKIIDMPTTTPLSQLRDVWMVTPVGQKNFPDINHALIAALTSMPIGNGLRARDIFCSPATWLLNPLFMDANGNPVPQPTFVDVAAPPALNIAANLSAAERGSQLTDYGLCMRIWEYDGKIKIVVNAADAEARQFLINPLIWGDEVARIAEGSGFDHVTDTLHTIYSRIEAHLAHFDAEAERRIKGFCRLQCDTNVAVYISDEFRCHTILHALHRKTALQIYARSIIS